MKKLGLFAAGVLFVGHMILAFKQIDLVVIYADITYIV